MVGRLDRVRTVADVTADLRLWLLDKIAEFTYNNFMFYRIYLNGEIATNGAWCRVGWVGGAEHDTSGLDDALSLPDHGDNRARVHVVNQTGEEGTRGQIGIVLLQMSAAFRIN